MITNDKQHQTTMQRLEGFKRALVMLNAPDNELKQKNTVRWQLNIDGLLSFIDDFDAQIKEYEEVLKVDDTKAISFTIHNLEDLPRVLIKARIAAKISQSSVANLLGISLEQFQRYEDWEYQEATLTQLLEVSQFLGIQFQPCANIMIASPLKTA